MLYWTCLLCITTITLAYSFDIETENAVINDNVTYYNHKVDRKGDTVELKLYYECLCPYCIDFYTDTLNKTVTKLASYLDLKTYPYGNAKEQKVNGTTIFTCQHGPDECYGNKLHACAIDILKNVTLSEFYNACMMSAQWEASGSTDEDAINCGKLMEIDANPIIECAKGKKGTDLLEYYGEETRKVPNREGVPWILINGKFYDEDNYDNFIPTICAALAHPPPQCTC